MESLIEKLIDYIVEYKKVDRKELNVIQEAARNFKEFSDRLLKEKVISEEDILLLLSREYSLPYLDLDKYRLQPENKNLLPKDMALRYKVLPISKIGNVLTLATADPLNIVIFDDLKLTTFFKKIDLVLAKEDKIVAALNKLYSNDTNIVSLLKEDKEDDAEVSEITNIDENKGLETLIKESNLPPIVRVVDLIIFEGLQKKVSDIHIEPMEDKLTVRFRVDGILHQGLSLPKRNQSAVLARLKIMSSLNITEFRLPQDGRFKVRFEGREVDFRVSSLPTNFGEKIVLRILDRQRLATGIRRLGFSEKPLKLFEKAVRSPFGIILVTGPTGSGKSTTLYSIINQLNNPEKNIITIEDPVEYQIEGITQTQVKPEIGLTFASCLRCVLRQSPDIVMIGEIRDNETADIAIKASLTGEFIFSTLHTNSSVGAITRIVDMGVEPFLVASSLVASTAQRLLRTLCPKCKVKGDIDRSILRRLGLSCQEGEFFQPQGCNYCGHTGYHGRIALLEVLYLDDTMREMIIKRASEYDILEYARAKNVFSSLVEDGFAKCITGVTTVEEVLRVAG
ncbi:MAG: GspE/PulE family protein [Candidatus Omnitrophota bacterium]